MTLGELATAIREQASDVPAGRIDGARATIRVVGSITDVETLGNLVVRVHDGGHIRVLDLARIEDTVDDDADDRGFPLVGIRLQARADAMAAMAAVRQELAELRRAVPSGITLAETTPPPPAATPPAQLVIVIAGSDLEMLERIADNLTTELQGAGALAVYRDPPPAQPERIIVPDRARAAALGVAFSDLADTLRVLVAGTHLGELRADGRDREIVLRIPPEAAALDARIADVQVRTRDGGLVPLASVVAVTITAAPTITRRDRQRVVTLSVHATGSALAAVRTRFAALAGTLPVGYRATTSP
ncbi:MAG: efflux RND transporter permease subunit [Deltaproteobacteria bacterium]|nr:efflux RND transporter permease subunit [Deltaproteobacteria bacterium]